MDRRRRGKRRLDCMILSVMLVIAMLAQSMAVFAQENVGEEPVYDTAYVVTQPDEADASVGSDSFTESDESADDVITPAEEAGPADTSDKDEAADAVIAESDAVSDAETAPVDSMEADEAVLADDSDGSDSDDTYEYTPGDIDLPENLGDISHTFMVGDTWRALHNDDPSWDESTGLGELARTRKTTYTAKPKGVLALSYKKDKKDKKKYVCVKAKKSGYAGVTVSTKWKGGSYEWEDYYKFHVTKPAVETKKYTVNSVNDTYNMSSLVSWSNGIPQRGYSVTWKSSNKSVVNVDDSGNVRFLKKGTGKVTGTYTSGNSGKATVTVTFKVAVPTLSKTCVILKPKKVGKVTLKNASNVSWSSSTDIVHITGTGGKNGETVSFKVDSPGVYFMTGVVNTQNGYEYYTVVLGVENLGYSDYSINGEYVQGRIDYKLCAQMIDKYYQYRLKNGLGRAYQRSYISNDAKKRVVELAEGNVYYSPGGYNYGNRGCIECYSYQPSSAAKAFNAFMKDPAAKSAMADPDYEAVGCVVLKLKKKITVNTGKKIKADRFMIFAIGPYY